LPPLQDLDEVFDVGSFRGALEAKLRAQEAELQQVRGQAQACPAHPARRACRQPPHTLPPAWAHTSSSLPNPAAPPPQVERLQRQFSVIHSTLAQQHSNAGPTPRPELESVRVSLMSLGDSMPGFQKLRVGALAPLAAAAAAAALPGQLAGAVRHACLHRC
jgi:hypothetical protein